MIIHKHMWKTWGLKLFRKRFIIKQTLTWEPTTANKSLLVCRNTKPANRRLLFLPQLLYFKNKTMSKLLHDMHNNKHVCHKNTLTWPGHLQSIEGAFTCSSLEGAITFWALGYIRLADEQPFGGRSRRNLTSWLEWSQRSFAAFVGHWSDNWIEKVVMRPQ
jgi:hypothetical protein